MRCNHAPVTVTMPETMNLALNHRRTKEKPGTRRVGRVMRSLRCNARRCQAPVMDTLAADTLASPSPPPGVRQGLAQSTLAG
jgi:hypothetical protein